ncbi:MAG TPA: hypothetical protein VLF89_10190 [Candidatus Saccharimonadales bacterium]|nr:hypothetical protein [Candidatus Saccharimonadales bacterium]
MNTSVDGNNERYVVVTQNGNHLLYQDTSKSSINNAMIIRDAVSTRQLVTPLRDSAATVAYEKITGAYKSIGDAMNRGPQDSFNATVQSL